MQQLRAAIVDDEDKARLILESMLSKQFPDVTVTGQAASMTEAIELIQKQSIDLLFLDIELGDGTGFDVLRQLPRVDFQIIFTTAYNQFAIEAFRVNAIDYLLKPVEYAELDRAIEKAFHQKKEVLADELQRLGAFISRQEASETMCIHEMGHISFIRFDQISYFKAEGQYTRIYLSDGTNKVSSQNLGYYEKLTADNRCFFRPHRSYMINLSIVSGLNTSDQLIELTSGTVLPYSSELKDALLAKLSGKK